ERPAGFRRPSAFQDYSQQPPAARRSPVRVRPSSPPGRGCRDCGAPVRPGTIVYQTHADEAARPGRSTMASLKMTFGKYKGKRISKLPTDYLVWCLDKCDSLTDEMRKAVEEELAGRDDAPKEDAEEQQDAAEAEGLRPTKVSPLGQGLAGDVRMLFRTLALKYHPD